MQLILDQNLPAANIVKIQTASAGRRIGLLASLFGCWHKRLTRPFTTDKDTYMACLECGARKKVDAKKFQSIEGVLLPSFGVVRP